MKERTRAIHDGVDLKPQTSYGPQKVIEELLINTLAQRYPTGRLACRPSRSGRRANAARPAIVLDFRDTWRAGRQLPGAQGLPVWHTAPPHRDCKHNHARGRWHPFGTNPTSTCLAARTLRHDRAMSRALGPDAEAGYMEHDR